MRPTILLVQPTIQPPGGGPAVAAWILQALRDDYSISLATQVVPDLQAVNAHFGTSITADDFTLLINRARLDRVVRSVLDRFPSRMTRVRRLLFTRWCRRLASSFDLVISGSNEIDVAHRTIQYVHYPYWAHRLEVDSRRSTDRWALAYRIYARILARLGDESLDGTCNNLTLTNSQWTARRIRETHGPHGRIEVLHPPVHGAFPSTPWERRKNGFIALGRIHTSKRLVEVIEIVERVRAAGHETTLDIVGSVQDTAYFERIRRLADERPWITISLDLPRAELPALLASFRYGLHGMPVEHFGMAVAEMATAGCIVFVPRGGGQVEIVGGDERLLYDGPEEAARKIARVLEDEPTQRALRDELRARVERFSLSAFTTRIRTIVRDEIGAGHSRPGP